MARRIGFLVVLMLAAQTSVATTITVRKDGTGDFTIIQQGLDAAASGDTVLIGPGEYTESSMVRLNGYTSDVEVFGRIAAADVTVIGSGAESTIVGPTTFQGNYGTHSPKCIAYDAGFGAFNISDLTLRNCYEGIWVGGLLRMERCHLENNIVGFLWLFVGSGGFVRDTRVDVNVPILSPMSFDIGYGAVFSGVTFEGCYFGDGGVVRGVQGMSIRNCQLSGLGLYSGSRTYLNGCTSATSSNSGVSLSLGGGAYCEIRDCELRAQYATLHVSQDAPGGRFVVENSHLEGGAHGVLYSGPGAGACSIHNCDLVKGSGPMVECAVSASAVTHDLSNNFWGTTSAADIQSWIIDHNDNAAIGATVLYSPFSGQSVPSETTTWGDLKALFR